MFRRLLLSLPWVDRESGLAKGLLIFPKVARIQTCLSKDKHWPQICLLAGWVRRARKLPKCFQEKVFVLFPKAMLQMLLSYSIQDKQTRMLRKTPKVDCTFISICGFLGGTYQHYHTSYAPFFLGIPNFLRKLPNSNNTPADLLLRCRVIKSDTH